MTSTKLRAWLITGVSSGLGRALAEAALACGDVVAGTVRSETDQQAFESLAPGRAQGFLMDVTDHAAIQEAVASIEDSFCQIDVLVNNAGYCLVGAIEEASADEIRHQFDVNVFGTTAVIQAVLPFMRERRSGHIVNVSSISGLATWEGTGIYCASKHALEGITQTLAQEVRGLGIKVTNIEPGGMRTKFGGSSMKHTEREIEDYKETAHNSRKLLEQIAGNESGDPKKIAQAVLKVVDAENPPLQLLLGADALHYMGQKMGALQVEMADWAPVTLSVAFDEVNE